jgi:hypothetical protein
MTAIAALIDKDKTIWVGGDSAGVAGLDLEVRKDPKVFVKDEFIMGFTTSFRMGQILHYKFKSPKHPNNMSIDTYMNTIFIDKIRSCLERGGFGNGKDSGGTFIVGYRKRLFVIDKDFQVGFPHKNYTAVGCGHNLCKGSLHATDSVKDIFEPKERIKLALTAAESFSGGVRRPFIIKSLKHDEI